ncbi:MAG: ribose-phosphate diphosphokinase [Candidatus Paceibacterota bacterium]
MGKNSKHQILHSGGIAIVCTPSMEYMARASFEMLRKLTKKKSLDFHVVEYVKFSKGEVLPIPQKSVRLKHVYLFYDFNGDACHDAFVLQLTVSALQDAGADAITLVMPFIPFLRQDRKDRSRVPISARDFIQGYERYDKVERTITLDMHADQTQGVFTKRSDHLPGHVIFVPWIKQQFGDRLDDLVVIGPDAGSEKRVSAIAKRVGCKRAFITKERVGGEAKMHEIHGASVKGKICLINDDIMDTCGTITQAAEALKAHGAKEVILSATHAVFGGPAYERLAASGFKVITTDSLRTKEHDWLTVLPLADYMAYAVLQNNIVDGSVSEIIRNGLPIAA